MGNLILYWYFLGQFAIGPFTDLQSCNEWRRYQLVQGGVDAEHVTQCVSIDWPKGRK